MSTYVIGDIHGEITQLKNLLENINYEPNNDKLIFLGDYIDRGEDSRATVKYIRNNLINGKNIFLLGNHEDMLLKGKRDLWLYNGGAKTLNDYNQDWELINEELISWIEGLKVVHYNDNHIFVHAGISPDTNNLLEQKRRDLLWIRAKFLTHDWSDYDRIIFHGHTPVKEVTSYGKRVNIDTGAGKGGKLSAFELDTGKVYDSREDTQ